MKLWQKNVLLLAAVTVIALFPMFLLKDAEFGGTDGQAQEMIEQIAPEYTPWAELPFTPPSGEIESLLFAVQAALGAGVGGFLLGRLTAKGRNYENAQ